MIGELSVGLLLVQASSCMALGLLGSYLWARRPARGHQILLICMAAGVVLPGLYVGVQHLGLGQLKNDSPAPDRVEGQIETMTLFKPAEPMLFPVGPKPFPEMTPTITTPVVPGETKTDSSHLIPWALVGMGIWGAMSCLALASLMRQFVLGLYLIRGRHSVEDDSLTQALVRAQHRLNLNRPVTLCFSPKISSPVIWCWGKIPILLVPDIANPTQACKDWVGVFCHELAHVKRLDHITNLWADLLCVALPWHPLVWWARQRLLRLSEDVCDDWALVHGHASTKYAESLLALTSQKALTLLPGIIGKERPMKARISRIIKGQISNPKPGTGWTCLWATVTLCSIVGMALAQARPEEELRAAAQRRAREEALEPLELGVIKNGLEQKVIDIAVIGRLNVLNHLLEQLTDQAAKTEQTLDQAKTDSDRHMHQVELDTLREQIARIKTQIQQTKHPEEDSRFLSTRWTMPDIPNLQERPARSPAGEPGRWVPTQTSEGRGVSWRFVPDSGRETEQRVLQTRRKQITRELAAVESSLRRQYETGRITNEEFQGRLRPLKNELELIDAQLGEEAEPPKQQLVSYSLEHIPAYKPYRIIESLMDQVKIIKVTPDSMDILATPEKHDKIRQLLEQLDTPRTDAHTTNTPGPARTVRSTSSTARTVRSMSSAPMLPRAVEPGSRPVSNSNATTRTSPEQTLNAEVDDLRGQVKGLHDQMQEIRAMLEQLVKQQDRALDQDPMIKVN
ncbi:MAG: M56 family metallopeptidase [Phycisphaerae bacterium]|nr:M56 family metallopeptidase [Phycisphaerae bacterium]